MGKYAVKKPDNIPATNAEADDLYIPCRRKGVEIRHTYERGKLCVMFLDCITTGRNAYKRLREVYPDMYLEFEEIGIDAMLYFMDEDMPKIAKEVHPKTSGKNKAPYGKKSLMKNFKPFKKQNQN